MRSVAPGLLLVIVLGSFLRIGDAPAAHLTANGTAVYSKSARALGSERESQTDLALNGIFHPEPPAVPASFLLFDFKQNLRRWPVLAGDISRSPPFLLGL